MKARTLFDVKIHDKKENLKKAKKNLQRYEETFEQHMPKAAKLRRMKEAAKEAIDENYFYDRKSFPRSKFEDEQLEQKIKDMEMRTGVDFAPLFDSKQKEEERVKRHKKAFETYKSYSFLKAGLPKTKLEKKITKDPNDDVAQYEFPSPDKVAKVFVNDDYKYSMLKEAEVDTKSGRKFKFTPRDFMEKYFGKDNLNHDSLELSDRQMYSFNDELKRVYPYETISFNPVTHLQKLQEKASKNALKRDLLTPSERNPEWNEETSLKKKETDSRQIEIDLEEPFKGNPFVKDEPWEKRLENIKKKVTPKDGKLKKLIIFRVY